LKNTIISILKYIAGLSIGGVLLYLTFRNINLEEAWIQISSAKFGFVLGALAVSLFSHFLRAFRWKMLLKPAGFAPDTYNTFAAVMVGYMANNAVPRLGEITRCSMLLKSDKVPFSSGIGSVVLERVIDLLVMLGFIGLAFLLEYDRLMQIALESIGAAEAGPKSNTGIYYLLVILPFLVLAFFMIRKYLDRILQVPVFQKIMGFISNLWVSLIGIRHLENPVSFLGITALIWICYIGQYYVCFFALDDTSGLSFYFAMMVMIVGGIGIVLPVPGGVGAFHFFCQLTFISFGYSEQTGAGYALLIHTSQYLMLVAVGAIAYFSLLFRPERNAALSQNSVPEI